MSATCLQGMCSLEGSGNLMVPSLVGVVVVKNREMTLFLS